MNRREGSTCYLVLLFSCALCWSILTMHVCAENRYEIKASDPEIGAQDVLEYTGEEESYVVKISGIYEVTAYGAQGGESVGKNPHEGSASVWGASNGKCGSMAKSRIALKEGCELTVCVGQKGGVGTCDTYHGDNLRCAPGGYPDGATGKDKCYFNDNDHDKNANALGGGGGGSSYIKYEGEKILSAKGGQGASMWIDANRMHNEEAQGGAGGGDTFVKDAADLVWLTEEVKEMTDGVREGNGAVVFTLIQPALYLTVSTNCDDWTKDDVTIEVTIHSDKTLPDDCFLWENVADLEENWTDRASVSVSKNGTYICRGRDEEGNETFAEIKITNIDKDAPCVSYTLSESDWTKEPVRITIDVDDGEGIGLPEFPVYWMDSETPVTEEDGELEIVWNNIREKTLEENGRVCVLACDKLGNKREWTYEITNIDHTAPTVSLTHEGKWTSGKMLFTIEAKDLQPDGQTVGCGLPDEAFSTDGVNYTAENTLLVAEEGNVTVWVRDRLGNKSENHIRLSHDRIGDSDSHHGNKHGKDGQESDGTMTDAEALNPADEFPADLQQIEIDERLREYKELSESHAHPAISTRGVLVKEEPGFAQIAAALGTHPNDSDRGELKITGSGENGEDTTVLEASDTLPGEGGIMAILSAGKKWVTRFIQKWKHVITYSLTGIFFFGLMGLGCFLYLIRKRKK